MTATTRWALRTFALGFVVEGTTEAYQFLSTAGSQHTAWIGFYYVGLATTILGFYLMYVGRHEWTALHRQRLQRGRRLISVAVAMFVGAAVALGAIAYAVGPSNTGGVPGWAVAIVGGLVALALGNFFLSLVLLVHELVGRLGRWIAWGAFAWSLGVAGFAGYAVGGQIRSLLGQLFSNPLGLAVGFAPLAFVLSPLFVTYALFAIVYLDALRRLAPGRAALFPRTDLDLTGSSDRRESGASDPSAAKPEISDR